MESVLTGVAALIGVAAAFFAASVGWHIGWAWADEFVINKLWKED